MKQITVKYTGQCRKCGNTLQVNDIVMYEKHVGIFCLNCAPQEPNEIRSYRQDAADKRASKLDEWAEKREQAANKQLNTYPEIRHDLAFITQPGRIPFRDRMNQADNRALESLTVAQNMRNKADNLRHVKVAGDAERARQQRRDVALQWLKVGMTVRNPIYSIGTVERINKKTAKVNYSGFRDNSPIDWLKAID